MGAAHCCGKDEVVERIDLRHEASKPDPVVSQVTESVDLSRDEAHEDLNKSLHPGSELSNRNGKSQKHLAFNLPKSKT